MIYSDRHFATALQVTPGRWVDATAVASVEVDALRAGCIVRMSDGARFVVPAAPGKDVSQKLHWLLQEIDEQAWRTRCARAAAGRGS